MVSAAVMVWTAGLTDQFRVRWPGTLVLGLLAGECFVMATNTYVRALPLVILALRLTGQGISSHLSVVAISGWGIATRGRALAIVTLGFALDEALLLLSFVALMGVLLCRRLWVVTELDALLAIPLLTRLLPEERVPQAMTENNHSFGMEGRYWTRAQTLRRPHFWFMVPALLGPAAFNTAFFLHQVHFADVKGGSSHQARGAFSALRRPRDLRDTAHRLGPRPFRHVMPDPLFPTADRSRLSRSFRQPPHWIWR